MSIRILKRPQIFFVFLALVMVFISWRMGAFVASYDMFTDLDDIMFAALAVVTLFLIGVSILNRPQIYPLILVMVVILTSWRIGGILAASEEDIFRAYVVFGVLMATSLLLFKLVARSDPEGDRLFIFLLVSFALKLAAFDYRLVVGPLADARIYHYTARTIAHQLAGGHLPVLASYHGTGFIRLLAGVAYFVMGETFQGISMLWAWIGLMGMLFFYKAFSTAFPNGNRRLYMLLILLYPTMLMWTSTLGKDALMVSFLGMSAYGAARLRQRIDPIGVWWLLLGLGGTLMIRPHVTMLFGVALGALALIRPGRAGMSTPIVWFLGLFLFLGVAVGTVRVASGLVGVELTEDSVTGFVESARVRTGRRGGSAFAAVSPRGLVGAAIAIPTVLFRPFPTEAHNTVAGISSFEGVGLLALMLYRCRNVGRAIVGVTRNSYLLLVVVYTLLFIFAFAGAIGNFGILARERAQVLPFVFMLIAYEPRRTETE